MHSVSVSAVKPHCIRDFFRLGTFGQTAAKIAYYRHDCSHEQPDSESSGHCNEPLPTEFNLLCTRNGRGVTYSSPGSTPSTKHRLCWSIRYHG